MVHTCQTCLKDTVSSTYDWPYSQDYEKVHLEEKGYRKYPFVGIVDIKDQ